MHSSLNPIFWDGTISSFADYETRDIKKLKMDDFHMSRREKEREKERERERERETERGKEEKREKRREKRREYKTKKKRNRIGKRKQEKMIEIYGNKTKEVTLNVLIGTTCINVYLKEMYPRNTCIAH